MPKQLSIVDVLAGFDYFGDFGTMQETLKKEQQKLRRKWENGFQRWCNTHSEDESDSLGICGWGFACDYCEDNSYGRPCVRALNARCRETDIEIDYLQTSYENAWKGKL